MPDTLFDAGEPKPKTGGKARKHSAPPPVWVFDELETVHGIPRFVSRKWKPAQVWAVLYRSRERKKDPFDTAKRKRDLVRLLTAALSEDTADPTNVFDLFQEVLSLLDLAQKTELCRAALALLVPPDSN